MKSFFKCVLLFCVLSVGATFGQEAKKSETGKGAASASVLAPAVTYDTSATFAKAHYDTLLLTPEFFRTNEAGRKLPRAYEFSAGGGDSLLIAFVVVDTLPNVKRPALYRINGDFLVMAVPRGFWLHDFLLYSLRMKEKSNPIYDLTIFETGPLTESDVIYQASQYHIANPLRYEQMTVLVGAKPVNVIESTKFIRRRQGDLLLQRSLGILLTRRGRDDFNIERVPSIVLAVGLVFVSEGENVAGNGLSK